MASILVVLLLFFLGQDLHLCGISDERSLMSLMIRIVEAKLGSQRVGGGRGLVVRERTLYETGKCNV